MFDEDELFTNPLDSGAVEYDLPALTFFPNEITTSYGQIFSVEVFAMGYENLAGSFVVFEYDPNRVEVSSILRVPFLEMKPMLQYSFLKIIQRMD